MGRKPGTQHRKCELKRCGQAGAQGLQTKTPYRLHAACVLLVLQRWVKALKVLTYKFRVYISPICNVATNSIENKVLVLLPGYMEIREWKGVPVLLRK